MYTYFIIEIHTFTILEASETTCSCISVWASVQTTTAISYIFTTIKTQEISIGALIHTWKLNKIRLCDWAHFWCVCEVKHLKMLKFVKPLGPLWGQANLPTDPRPRNKKIHILALHAIASLGRGLLRAALWKPRKKCQKFVDDFESAD